MMSEGEDIIRLIGSVLYEARSLVCSSPKSICLRYHVFGVKDERGCSLLSKFLSDLNTWHILKATTDTQPNFFHSDHKF